MLTEEETPLVLILDSDETGATLQMDIDGDLMDDMNAILQKLRTETSELKTEVLKLKTRFDIDYCRDNNDKLKNLTGLQAFPKLMLLYQFLEPYYDIYQTD
jgi:hypothetical protein